MGKKKKLILDAARTLFNEKGYNQVTIRMIALKLNMSSGNLNYHYKKREDIFENLYFEMVSEFDERIKNLTTIEVSIAQIRRDIEQSMRRMIDYKFFWTDLYNLLAVSDKVKKHFQEVYKNRISGCFLLFEKMKKQNLMRDSSFELEYDFLAERMINYGNTWLYSTGLYLNKFTPNGIDNQVNMILSMLYPFFTPQGQKEFKNLLPEFFD
ncbi:TetR/AcrR family transcriptional regulator [Flavivirga spongiicola]|uniref:TetR/AcrR family transcriptional regulator n=1 Tax=Flavivirga spongiicola TaxID=421621 RepID=A0ABU7XM10_9FLAO|nr:TetR/AcrR family transcriptional regulator [Flavivirga sp. MEBiC05379]MDO5981229.1 TetR/AcrR family transcriptional regulator [Flavivirga sp. MEBiC05379]